MNRSRQRGVAAVIVLVALVALLAVAGLALDASHLARNKSRLQSTVDAAALSAAKTLAQTGSTTRATASANAIFATNAAAFPELQRAMGSVNVAIAYSNTVTPFAAGTAPARYVRVTASNFVAQASLSRVVGIERLTARASAISGPSPTVEQVCNLAPVLICGNPAAGPPYYGYTPGRIEALKSSGGNGSTTPVGPGNFQLVRLGDPGLNVLRDNMAGGYNGCIASNSMVETQTGDGQPIYQGLNTRFNSYSGGVRAVDFPPDVVTREPTPALRYDDTTKVISQDGVAVTNASEINYNHQTYAADVAAERYTVQPAPSGSAAFRRREMAVVIADCSGTNNGQTAVPVLALGCFFLTQKAQQLPGGDKAVMFGELLSSCEAGGRPGPLPSSNPGPYVIQLYRDPASPDS